MSLFSDNTALRSFSFLLAAAVFLCLFVSCSEKDESSASSEFSASEISPDVSEIASVEESSETNVPTNAPGNASDWNLILVNKSNPLSESFTVETASVGGGYEMDARAAEAMLQMIQDGNATGLNLMVCSAYRSVSYQAGLYERKVQEYINYGYSEAEARRIAGTIVAPPGTSEHATGLAADIVSVNYQVLDEGFENTPEFAWLSENAADYGFVLRFPEDKQDITDIIYEPWHYRYVGVEHAHAMNTLGMCLEEYVLLFQ